MSYCVIMGSRGYLEALLVPTSRLHHGTHIPQIASYTTQEQKLLVNHTDKCPQMTLNVIYGSFMRFPRPHPDASTSTSPTPSPLSFPNPSRLQQELMAIMVSHPSFRPPAPLL